MKNIKKTIKEYFLETPSSRLRVREIERTLKLPLPSIIRYCKELVEENILTTETIGNVKLYVSNKTHQNYILEKKIYNIKNIYKSGIIEYLKKELSNPTIILFGSYVKGEDTEESDIDLYIETLTKKQIKIIKFKKILNRDIQIFQYKNIEEIKNPHLANNIINGITLNNFIEVFK
jgi:predicted nucleotidyltransferase|tara:strand:- start:775 stop:1302 length:528 start_codon:yes stop_codon:yes gene_type:complete